MDTIHETGPTVPEMPRFDDGMVNISEPMRILAQSIVNEVMDARADEACAEGNSRNGYRERRPLTCVGEITLRIPKLRGGGYHPEDLLTRWSRTDRAVAAAVAEMFANGASTRRAGRAAKAMGIERMSASQVSRICGSLDEATAEMRGRDLSEAPFPYVWLDATYIKCREGGRVRSTALVTAIGAGSDGYRRLLGMDAIDTETYDGWRGLPLSLRERGVSGVICVTSDAREGLRRAIQEAFPGSAWQRRVVHLMRSAAGRAPTRRKRGAVPGILKAVFAERDPGLVREPCHLAIDEIGGLCPKAAELLEDAEPDALACLDFPYEHHVRLRTNNVQERCNRELKRRARVVQVFPSRRSLIRLMGAVFSEMDEEWACRRWFSDASIARAVEGAKVNAPASTYDGSVAEHAAMIMALVMADNPVPGRKAA